MIVMSETSAGLTFLDQKPCRCARSVASPRMYTVESLHCIYISPVPKLLDLRLRALIYMLASAGYSVGVIRQLMTGGEVELGS